MQGEKCGRRKGSALYVAALIVPQLTQTRYFTAPSARIRRSRSERRSARATLYAPLSALVLRVHSGPFLLKLLVIWRLRSFDAFTASSTRAVHLHHTGRDTAPQDHGFPLGTPSPYSEPPCRVPLYITPPFLHSCRSITAQ